jgi:hypothetical protein
LDAGCLFRLCGSDFGITPVDITNGITWAVLLPYSTYFIRQLLLLLLLLLLLFSRVGLTFSAIVLSLQERFHTLG